MFRALKDFYDRRLKIPVNWEGLVLDVGSGEKPHWRADVLCDLYPEESFAHFRSGGGKAVNSAPLVIANAQKLPFRDKAFDFVVASHLLQQVNDPEAACQELQRVAKAGYIELPAEAPAKINDAETSLWWCRLEGRKLVFIAKESSQFDPEVYQFSKELISRKAWFEKVVHPHFDLVSIRFWWSDGFEFEVRGTPSKSIQNSIDKMGLLQTKKARNKESFMLKIFRKALKVFFWHKTRKEPFVLRDVLQCPFSKETEIEKVSPTLYRGKNSHEVIRVMRW